MNLVVNNHECEGLIDSGAQVTTIIESFAKSSVGIQVHNLIDILSVEGTRGIDIRVQRIFVGQIKYSRCKGIQSGSFYAGHQ